MRPTFLYSLVFALCLSCSNAHAQFNAQGVSYFNPRGPADNSYARAVAVLPDGRFLVAGESYLRDDAAAVRLHVERFEADGSRDSSFGFSLSHSGTLRVRSGGLLALPDGGALVVFTLTNPNTPQDSFSRVIRLTPAGASDPTFSDFEFDPSSGGDSLSALALQADGRILAAGSRRDANNSNRIAVLVRLEANGALDTGFGSDGYVSQAGLPSAVLFQTFYPEPDFSAISLMPDGRIVLVGTAENFLSARSELLMLRLNENGSRDQTFNSGEPLLYAQGSGSQVGARTRGRAADVSPEGFVLAGGASTAGGSQQAYLWLFDPSGQLVADEADSFGDFDELFDVQLLPNGGAVGVGSFSDGGVSAALMAFYTQGLGFSGGFSGRFTSESRAHSLSALGFDPVGQRLISVGAGITQESGLFANRWVFAADAIAGTLDTLPDPLADVRFEGVTPGAQVDSGLLRATGVDDFVRVPLRVRSGRLQAGGGEVESPSLAQPALRFANTAGTPAGFDLRLLHQAAPNLGVETITVLELGGVVRSNNLALTLGPTRLLKLESLTGQGTAIFADGFEP